jgi:hypothetical protein
MSDIITRDDLLNDNKFSGGSHDIDMNEFYSSLYDINGGNTELALKTKQYLEDNLSNSIGNVKVKAKKYIFNKLSEYNDKLKGASQKYISQKLDQFNGGLLDNSKIYDTVDLHNQKVYNNVTKIVDKKLDKYYDIYKKIKGGNTKSNFKNIVENLKDKALQKLKKDFKKGVINRKERNFRGGYIDTDSDDDVDSEIESEFNNGANLDKNQLEKIKENYDQLVIDIKNIDNEIDNIIEKTNENNIKEHNITFNDLIIKRRILLESVKAIEMKYNSIHRDIDNRLDHAIDLIREDKLKRELGGKKGLDFEIDDIIKEVFELNLKLSSANDTLLDFIKLLDEKLDVHTLRGGFPKYNFYIGNELQNNNFIGGASKESTIEKLKDVAEKYIELVTKLKEKENFILGLPHLNQMIIEELKEYVIDLDTIIKKIHVLNTRFTNPKIKDDIINKILDKLYEIDNKYNKYAGRLKTLLKVNDDIIDDRLQIKERIIGGIPSQDILDKKNELNAKMLLLHDNLKYKIKHRLISNDEKNNFLGGIDDLANIDNSFDLNQLGNYDDNIEDLIDQLNSFKGGSVKGDQEELVDRYLLYQIAFHAKETNTPMQFEKISKKLREYAKLNESKYGNFKTFLVPTHNQSIDPTKQHSYDDILKASCQVTFGKLDRNLINNVNPCVENDMSGNNDYSNLYEDVIEKNPSLKPLLKSNTNNLVNNAVNLANEQKEKAAAAIARRKAKSESVSQSPESPVVRDGPSGRDGRDGPAGPAGPVGPIGPIGPAGQDGQPGPAGKLEEEQLRQIKQIEDNFKQLQNIDIFNITHHPNLKKLITNIDNNLQKLDQIDDNIHLSTIKDEIGKLTDNLKQNNTRIDDLNLPKLLKDIQDAIEIAKKIVGQPGAKGDVGSTGPVGPIGPRGKDGLMGPIGPNGKEGPLGPMGPKGEDGKDGKEGPHGREGPTGPKGEDAKMDQAQIKELKDLQDNFNILKELDIFNPGHHDNLKDLITHIDSNLKKLNQIDNDSSLSKIVADIDILRHDLDKNNTRIDDINLPTLLNDINNAIKMASEIVGKEGPPGEKGADGKDGPPGPRGADGKDGPPGQKGEDGIVDPIELIEVKSRLETLSNDLKYNSNPERMKEIIIDFLNQHEGNPIINKLHKLIDDYLNNLSIPTGAVIDEIDNKISELKRRIDSLIIDTAKIRHNLKENIKKIDDFNQTLIDFDQRIQTDDNIKGLINSFLMHTSEDDDAIKHLRNLLTSTLEKSTVFPEDLAAVRESLHQVIEQNKIILSADIQSLKDNYNRMNETIFKIERVLPLDEDNIRIIHDFLQNIHPNIDNQIDVKLQQPIQELHRLIEESKNNPGLADLSKIRSLIEEVGSAIKSNIEELNNVLLKISENSLTAATSAEQSAKASLSAAHSSSESSSHALEAAQASNQAVNKLSDIADKILAHMLVQKDTTHAQAAQPAPIIYNNHTIGIPSKLSESSSSSSEIHKKHDEHVEHSEHGDPVELDGKKESLIDKLNKIKEEERRMILILRKALKKTSYEKDSFLINNISNRKVSYNKYKPKNYLLEKLEQLEETKPTKLDKHQKGGNINMSARDIIKSMKAGKSVYEKSKEFINKHLPKKQTEEQKINNYIDILNKIHIEIDDKINILTKLLNNNKYYIDSEKLSNLHINTNTYNHVSRQIHEFESKIIRDEDPDIVNGGFSLFNYNPPVISNDEKDLIELLPRINDQKDILHKKLIAIFNNIGDTSIVDYTSDYSLKEIDKDIRLLSNDKNNCIKYLNNIIKTYESLSGIKQLEKSINDVNNFEKKINQKINEIKSYKIKYNIDQNSIEFNYMFKTVSRIMISIDLYKVILHAGIHTHNKKGDLIMFNKELYHEYEQLLNKSEIITEFKNLLVTSPEFDLNYNIWHMIININKIINNQIFNFNITLDHVNKEKELMEKKKEIIAKIEDNPNKTSKLTDYTYAKVQEYINEYSNDLPIGDITDELSLFKMIDNVEQKHIINKERSITKSNNFPDIELSQEEKDKIIEDEYIQENFNHRPITIDEIYLFFNDFDKYLKTIIEIEKEIKYIIHTYSAIKEAKDNNITLFKNIKCKKENSVVNYDIPKIYDARVLDIFSQNGHPFLKVKIKGHDIIKTISLNNCKHHNLTPEEKERLDEKNNTEAAEYAEKLGFKPGIQIRCSQRLSFFEKYYHKMTETSVKGKITRFTSHKDKLNRNRIKVELNNDSNELFKLENCEPEYEHALDKLDDVKQSKYIKKQLEKLKHNIYQIETLNPHKPDFELKLKILNREFDRIKEETDGTLVKSTKHEFDNFDKNNVESIEEDTEINYARKQLHKLQEKRKELEEALVLNSPKAKERIHPEETKIPYNLKKPLHHTPNIVGGHKMIQHAGFHPDYQNLKSTINNVSLDDILLQSNAILNQIK